MARVTVLGAGGFIGANMVDFLTAQGHHVHGVDIQFPLERLRLLERAHLLTLDLREYENVEIAIEGADWIIHLAADMGGVGFFSSQRFGPVLNNLTIDANVLRAVKEPQRLFYASSACAYPTWLQMREGRPPLLSEAMLPATLEPHLYEPIDAMRRAQPDLSYGWAKLTGLLLAAEATYDARVGVLHTVYGPWQEHSGVRMKFPTAAATKALRAATEQASKGHHTPIEVWGNGLQQRSYCYISDALAKIYAVISADSYSGPVNIGYQGAVSVMDVYGFLEEICDTKFEYEFMDSQPSGVLARDCDNTQFNLRYGEMEMVHPRRGFKALLAWLITEREAEHRVRLN